MIIKNGKQDEAHEISFDGTGSRLTSTNTRDAIIEASELPAGWNTMIGHFMVEGTKSTNPIWSEIGTTTFYSYLVAVNKEAWCGFTIPHDYKVGGQIIMFINFTTDGISTLPVRWQMDYSITKAHNQAVGANLFPPMQAFAERNPPGVALQHITAETPPLDIAKAEPDAQIHVKVTRVSTAINNQDDVFGLSISCHYETDSHSTLNRKPPYN